VAVSRDLIALSASQTNRDFWVPARKKLLASGPTAQVQGDDFGRVTLSSRLCPMSGSEAANTLDVIAVVESLA
jgi:hypothetical protein